MRWSMDDAARTVASTTRLQDKVSALLRANWPVPGSRSRRCHGWPSPTSGRARKTIPRPVRPDHGELEGEFKPARAQFERRHGSADLLLRPAITPGRGTSGDTDRPRLRDWPQAPSRADPHRMGRRRPALQHPTVQDPSVEGTRQAALPSGSLRQLI